MTSRNKFSRNRLIVIAFLIFATVTGFMLFHKYQSRQLHPTVPATTPSIVSQLDVTLFFAAPDGNGLKREARSVDACADLTECIMNVTKEIINGPLGDLSPTLPASSLVRQVTVNGDTAIIDFNSETAAGTPAGSSAEMAAVYSVVNTIALNFPQIKQVKFLIEGHEVDTFRGHLSLREPIPPDFTLEKG